MMQGPIIEQVAGAVAGKATVAKLNVDEGQAIAGRFGIGAIPTLLLLKDGVEVKRFVGVQTKKALVESIERALA
jgi:thioredoxin 1